MSREAVKMLIYHVILGQIDSLCIMGTAFFSRALTDWCEFSNPAFQQIPNYFLLSFGLAFRFGLKSQREKYKQREASLIQDEKRWPLSKGLYSSVLVYALAALFDTGGNFLAVLSYRYASVARVMLVDCLSIPIVMIISAIMLRRRYIVWHYIAVLVSLCGAACLVTLDAMRYGFGGAVIGDITTALSAVCYGASNVLQEKLVKERDALEFEGFLGLFGLIFSIIISLASEPLSLWKRLGEFNVIGLVCGYTGVMTLFYICNCVIMRTASAVFLNVSLQTADIYSVFLSVFVFDESVSWLEILGFIFIIAGATFYSAIPERVRDPKKHELEVIELVDPASEA